MEDYKKKYEDLVERFDTVLNLENVKESGVVSTDDIKKLIPELVDEDEMIMKKLVEYFLHYPDHEITYYGLKADSIISWLKKQADHAKFRESIQVGDQVTRNQDGVLVNLSQLKRVAKNESKKGG